MGQKRFTTQWPPLLRWWLLSLLLCMPLLQAEDEPLTDLEQWQKFSGVLDKTEASLNDNSDDTKVLGQVTADTLAVTKYAQECISRHETLLQKTAASLESLGDANPADYLGDARKKLDEEKLAAEKTLAQCRLLNLRAADLQEQARLTGQGILADHLSNKTRNGAYHFLRILKQPGKLKEQGTRLLDELGSLPVNLPHVYLALGYGLMGLFGGFLWSTHKRREYRKQAPDIIDTSPTLATLWNSLIRTTPFLLFFGLINLSFYFKSPGVTALYGLAATFMVLNISYTILRAMLRPPHELSGFTPLVETGSKKLFYWARLLLLMSFLGTLFQSEVFDNAEHDHLISIIRISIGTLTGLALIRLVWLLRNHLSAIKRFHLHLLSTAVIGTAMAALWLGYYNLSLFLFRSTMATVFILLIGWLLLRIPIEIFNGLDEGRAPWQQRLRKRMGLVDQQITPGLIWLRIAHILLVGGLIIVALLLVWGLSERDFAVMIAQISSGIQIGDFTLEPMRIFSGLLTLAFIIALTQFVKRNLTKSWLQHTALSRGAQEAAVTITGYVGILAAIFIGLSVAGIDFSNLAIIAGALSVGIGFGLQNIVNNFVSGLILLFERPIRRGDWVKVGTTEGYVKDISIRSTVINTFDRADIIVPNSDLISNQVTNMMLNDQYGRIIIPIRVAYGEDTAKVMETLEKVAEAHPAILSEYGELQSQVLFRSFGEYALNFELRCHIKDVEWVLIITSELNLAIDQAFKEADIKIPLPRQVVQVQQDNPPAPSNPADQATALNGHE